MIPNYLFLNSRLLSPQYYFYLTQLTITQVDTEHIWPVMFNEHADALVIYLIFY